MPNEIVIQEIENLLSEIISLGGANERSEIVPNMEVINANPAGLTGFVIVSDERDGDNILAKKVGSAIYTDGDLFNVIFPEGSEAIAFQQGSQSTNANIWEIIASTSTDIRYTKGDVAIGASITPAKRLHVVDGAGAVPTLIGEGAVIQNNDDAGDSVNLWLLAGATGAATLNFGDTAASTPGQIVYAHNNDEFVFSTNGDEVIWISSDGRLGVGTSDPDHEIHIERSSEEAALAISSGAAQSESLYFGYPLATTSFAIYRPASTAHLRFWHSVGGDHMTLTDGGNFGVGTTDPGAVVDILGSTPQFRVADVSTDATNKIGRFVGRHYTNAEEDVSIILSSSTSGATEIAIGGGDSPQNAATLISFWTGATSTTSGGSERARITSGGDMGIGTTSVSSKLHVDQASTTAAIPVLTLDQADLSEEFIDFVTTIGAGNPIDTAAVGAYYGKARVAVNGTFKYVALYDS